MDSAAQGATLHPAWQALVEHGLAVRWTTLAVGLRTSPHRGVTVSVGDVAAWAEAQVEASTDQPEEVYRLMWFPAGTGNDSDSVEAASVDLERLAAGERADLAIELAKWRLVAVAALVDRIERWPRDGADDDDLACDMWSACRELWEAWREVLGRVAFFYPGGQMASCYHGQGLDETIAHYRGWIAEERARLVAADGAP